MGGDTQARVASTCPFSTYIRIHFTCVHIEYILAKQPVVVIRPLCGSLYTIIILSFIDNVPHNQMFVHAVSPT